MLPAQSVATALRATAITGRICTRATKVTTSQSSTEPRLTIPAAMQEDLLEHDRNRQADHEQACQGVCKMRVGEDIARQQLANSNSHDIRIPAHQRIGGGISAHRIGKEKNECTDQGGCEN